MSTKMRLDVYLVTKELAQSRTHAQEIIEAGQVYLIQGTQKKRLVKPSLSVSSEMDIIVENGPANRYVSRGGLKLEGALTHLHLSVEQLSVLDVGISTGGFTDCLLQKGAAYVLGVDVGHGQVHSKLLQDSRLTVIEGVNARNLRQEQAVKKSTPENKFDFVVMDVSFISISLIIPELKEYLKPGGRLLSLVKPQFEVGIEGLSKGGIVKDASLYADVQRKVQEVCIKSDLRVIDYFASSIQGKDGNNEFFIYAEKV